MFSLILLDTVLLIAESAFSFSTCLCIHRADWVYRIEIRADLNTRFLPSPRCPFLRCTTLAVSTYVQSSRRLPQQPGDLSSVSRNVELQVGIESQTPPMSHLMRTAVEWVVVTDLSLVENTRYIREDHQTKHSHCSLTCTV